MYMDNVNLVFQIYLKDDFSEQLQVDILENQDYNGNGVKDLFNKYIKLSEENFDDNLKYIANSEKKETCQK